VTAAPVGLLLAAGAGRRMGTPKALLRDAGGRSFVDRALEVLCDGGCERLTVVLGAAADEARQALDVAGWGQDRARVLVAEDWSEGMGASLRCGLRSLADDPVGEAALVTLVDLPDVGPAVLRRVVAAGTGPAALVRATYGGRPGHPVLLGRDHWAGVAAVARGDHGARDYLAAHPHVTCECGDLSDGHDVDRPDDLVPR
jgi:CTP:molybdopterin cytidylyltransferase MocA